MIPSIPILLLAGSLAMTGAYMTGRIHGGDKVHAAWDKDRAQRTQAALEAEQEARRIEAERAAKAQEVTDNARRQVARAKADAASAASAAASLRDAASAAADRASACDSAATGRGAAGSLADVLSEVEREGRGMAETLDAAVIAGMACEAAYGALTPVPR